MRKCDNCWWYCHSVGKCYVSNAARTMGDEFARPMGLNDCCWQWKSDGLQDEERQAYNGQVIDIDALMSAEVPL